MIVANHYVRVGGRLYTQGEIIEMPLDEEQKARLARIGAITVREAARQEAPTPKEAPKPEKPQRAPRAKAEPVIQPALDDEAVAEDVDIPEIAVADVVKPRRRTKK